MIHSRNHPCADVGISLEMDGGRASKMILGDSCSLHAENSGYQSLAMRRPEGILVAFQQMCCSNECVLSCFRQLLEAVRETEMRNK